MAAYQPWPVLPSSPPYFCCSVLSANSTESFRFRSRSKTRYLRLFHPSTVLSYFCFLQAENPGAFITERAYNDLKTLTGFGPRITGSHANEVLAVDFLNRTIWGIQRQVHPNQLVELSVQTVSGSYYLDFHAFGAINAYANVQNVVVMIGGSEGKHSVLINAHFDSVPTSPGESSSSGVHLQD